MLWSACASLGLRPDALPPMSQQLLRPDALPPMSQQLLRPDAAIRKYLLRTIDEPTARRICDYQL